MPSTKLNFTLWYWKGRDGLELVTGSQELVTVHVYGIYLYCHMTSWSCSAVPISGATIHIQYSDIFSIKIPGKKDLHPSIIQAELCQVIPSQLYKQKVPEYLTMKVVEFCLKTGLGRFPKAYISFLFYTISNAHN